MRNVINFIIIGLYIVFLSSCGSTRDEETTVQNTPPADFQLQKVDSVQVDYLGAINLIDLSPDARTLLFYDWQRENYILVDRESSAIISEFSKQGDRPDNPGYAFRSPSFFDNSSILVAGQKGAFIFSREGEVLKKANFATQPNVGIYYSAPGSYIHPLQPGNSDYLVFPSVNPKQGIKTERQYYDSWRSLGILNMEDGEFEYIAPLPQNSRFFDGMAYEISHLMSTYAVYQNEIWLSLGGEDIIRAYQTTPPYGLLREISLPLKDYVRPNGKEPSKADPNSVVFEGDLGGVKSIFGYKGNIAMVYFPGFTDAQNENLSNTFEVDGEEAYYELYDQYKKDTPFRLLIITKEGEELMDIPLPSGVDGDGLIIRNDELWVQNNPDEEVEEDFVKVFQLTLDGI